MARRYPKVPPVGEPPPDGDAPPGEEVDDPLAIVEAELEEDVDAAPAGLTPGLAEAVVGPDMGGQRLDTFLAASVPGLSRSRAKALILSGAVSVGGRPATAASRAMVPGDGVTVTVPEPEPAVPLPEAIPLEILYEDDHILVLDKPPGLVVHPGAGNSGGTLVNALLAHCGDSLSGIGGVRRPGIVHRLDKDTSGLIVVAKTDRAHAGLSAQFADHGRTGPLERGYRALAWGMPRLRAGTIDGAIGRSPANRQRMAILKAGGREAITHYAVEEVFGDPADPIASLIGLQLETGRTHQIRVHLAAIGSPVVGDPDYGGGFATKAEKLPEPLRNTVRGFGRQALHAWLLGFAHPVTGKTLRFTRDAPHDTGGLVELFRSLRFGAKRGLF